MAKGFPDRIRQMAKSSTSGPRAAESIITSLVVNVIGKSSCPDRWPKCEFLVLEPPRLKINAFSCQLGGKMSISKQMAKGSTSSPRAAVSIFNTSVVNLIGRWSKCEFLVLELSEHGINASCLSIDTKMIISRQNQTGS